MAKVKKLYTLYKVGAFAGTRIKCSSIEVEQVLQNPSKSRVTYVLAGRRKAETYYFANSEFFIIDGEGPEVPDELFYETTKTESGNVWKKTKFASFDPRINETFNEFKEKVLKEHSQVFA